MKYDLPNRMKLRLLAIVAATLISATHITAQDSKQRTLASPDFPGVLVVDFGFNGFTTAPDTMDLSWWKSKSVSFYYMRSFPIGKKLTFNPAIGLSLEKYAFVEDITLGETQNSNGETVMDVVAIEADEVLKSKMAINYFDAPIEFRFYPKGSDRKGSFFIAAGGSLGILFESHTKVKFKENGVTKQIKLRDDFRQSNIRYGVHGRIGFGGVNFFYKEYFSKIFKPDGPDGTQNTSARTIGISISGF